MESPAGLIAQLAVTAKLLGRILDGDNLELAKPLHNNASGPLGKLAFTAEG